MRNISFLVIAFGMLFTSCNKNDLAVAPNALRINIASDPTTLDPRKVRNLNDVTICRMLFEGLTRTGKDGNTELAAADSVSISEDRLEYTFHIRDAVWSNGNPVTSHDFAESWKAILDPQFPTDIAYQLYTIKNAQKVKSGDLTADYLGIKTPDEKTLIVHLEQPTPYFLEICSMASMLPVPEKVAPQNPMWSVEPTSFVGNGPFVLKSWTHNDQLVVARNSSYWEASAVHLDEIELMMISPDTEIRMFEENKLDWAGSPLSTLPTDAVQSLKESKLLRISPLSGTYFFRVNTAEKIHEKENPLASADFRKAIAQCIDRGAIATHLLQGGQVAAKSLVPPEMGLIEEGYFKEVKNGKDLLKTTPKDPITILFVSGDRNMSITQAVQKQLETALGIEVNLEAVESKTFSQRIKQKDFQLAAGSWIADFNDPINYLEVFKYKNGSTNNTNWEDAKYIDLLDQSALCGDQDERKQILREAEKILMDQMPIIPVFHFAMNFLERDEIKGVALSPIGQIDFRWAEREVR